MVEAEDFSLSTFRVFFRYVGADECFFGDEGYVVIVFFPFVRVWGS
jgi:hypothetical protein